MAETSWREYSHKLGQLWGPGRDFDPIAALAPLGGAVRGWYPDAFEVGGSSLPEQPQFWHAFAGLVMLADWIGSDKKSFPLAQIEDRMSWARATAPAVLIEYGFDPSQSRNGLPPISFGRISPHPPHDIQAAVGEASGRVVILEAETGSGKTEAALYRFAKLFEAGEVDGLYFALPTRVAAKSIYDRVCAAVATMFPQATRPAVILAVPGYVKADGVAGRPMPDFEVLWDDEPGGAELRRRWAAEHPKRFLAGTIAVGTIDQALLGAIQVKHAHMRSASLLRHLLVVDEVHSSDVYMERLLANLLSQHTRAGGHALLLSATLGSAARNRLLGRKPEEAPSLDVALALPYPAISTSTTPRPQRHAGSTRDKSVQLELNSSIGDAPAVARLALDAAERGAKVLVIRNLHRTAVATAEALLHMAPPQQTMFRCGGVPTLHHGRFAREDRELLDAEIERQMQQERTTRGLVLIGTQTLEQSLDICADLLISDLCPADVLLQRIGRLHRHPINPRPAGFEAPRAVVLAPVEISSLLARGDFGLGGKHGPYRDLVALEATRRLVVAQPVWNIPAMNRDLVERATHPQSLDALTADLVAVDPRWLQNRQDMEGTEFADAQVASVARLNWRKAFGDETFAFPTGATGGVDDGRFGTRLGAQDLVVTLPEGTTGPFGRPIRSISIPHFWLGDIKLDGDIQVGSVSNNFGTVTFTIQTQSYRYDRFGLAVMRSPRA